MALFIYSARKSSHAHGALSLPQPKLHQPQVLHRLRVLSVLPARTSGAPAGVGVPGVSVVDSVASAGPLEVGSSRTDVVALGQHGPRSSASVVVGLVAPPPPAPSTGKRRGRSGQDLQHFTVLADVECSSSQNIFCVSPGLAHQDRPGEYMGYRPRPDGTHHLCNCRGSFADIVEEP